MVTLLTAKDESDNYQTEITENFDQFTTELKKALTASENPDDDEEISADGDGNDGIGNDGDVIEKRC